MFEASFGGAASTSDLPMVVYWPVFSRQISHGKNCIQRNSGCAASGKHISGLRIVGDYVRD